ncbi:DHS-like NAD protein [Coleophoma cylindrospora]|uniref:DHS-like NAD protein n=1 Tax=Coleophoma cylindrospora TaxID=1849047 RepID=A0A3D8SRB8_9HELO|nr:DHS-like NAD protein [Coleophoma cylindrospora]
MSSPLSSPLSSIPSSPLSSIASRSPTPPTTYAVADYPSPSSINLTDDTSAQEALQPVSNDHDGPPPAKKRRVMTPKERTTEYLDLRAFGESLNPEENKEQDAQLKRLTKALRGKRKIVVIAGAGISVSAGIPDFRSSTGLFNTLRSEHKLKASGKHLFDASVYKNDDSTSSFHDMVRELSHLTQNAQPTAFHHMLAALASEGRLLRLYSQNIDGIDTSLPPLATSIPLSTKGPWPKTVQLHGGLEKMVCTKCGELSAFDGTLFEGPETPLCQTCEGNDQARMAAGLRGHGVGRLRPRMVLYNEFNPDDEAIGAVSHADLKSRPDAVIVVGTSLKVPGVRRIAREMCSVARGRRDGFTAWINNDPEPLGVEFKDCWDMVVRGACDEVARHVCLPRWDDEIGEFQNLSSSENKAKIPKNNVLGVVVESKQISTVKADGGILTPTASPKQQSPAPLAGIGNLKQPKLFQSSSKAAVVTESAKPNANKPAAPKKKPGRPRKPLPNGKPLNKITSAFTTTKTTKLAAEKNTKPIKEENPVDKSGIKTARLSNLGKHELSQSSTPTHPLSSLDLRHNSLINDEEEEASFVTCPESPCTPLMTEKQIDRATTISPPSKPLNMAGLID